jgi:hypothetical protein
VRPRRSYAWASYASDKTGTLHELSSRLDAVWRYDQYILNAERENAPQARQLWQDIKEQDLQMIERLKELIREHVRKNDF